MTGKNIIINSVAYPNVPKAEIPLSDEEGKAVYVETSDATAAAADIRSGKTAYVNGTEVVGSLTTPVITQDPATKVLTVV